MDDYHKRIIEKKKQKVNIANDAQKHMYREEEENGYQKINQHSEGRCYDCASTDYVYPILVDYCYSCIGKRGEFQDSSLITMVKEKPELFCMSCSKWRFGGAQLNARVCMKCGYKIRRNLNAYYRGDMGIGGGYLSNPFYRKVRKDLGSDWLWLQQNQWDSWRK